MKQLDLFTWAETRPLRIEGRSASNVIDVMPAIITKIAREPWPLQPKNGQIVILRRRVA